MVQGFPLYALPAAYKAPNDPVGLEIDLPAGVIHHFKPSVPTFVFLSEPLPALVGLSTAYVLPHIVQGEGIKA